MVDIITRLWNTFCHVYAVDPVLESDQNYRIAAHVFLRHGTHRFAEFGSIGVPKGSVRGRYSEMDIGRLAAVCTENSVYERRGNEFHSDLYCPRYQLQSILCPQSYDDSALTPGQGPKCGRLRLPSTVEFERPPRHYTISHDSRLLLSRFIRLIFYHPNFGLEPLRHGIWRPS